MFLLLLTAPQSVLGLRFKVLLSFHAGFPKRDTFLGGPDNKDSSILGSKLGSPHFGKPPCVGSHLS